MERSCRGKHITTATHDMTKPVTQTVLHQMMALEREKTVEIQRQTKLEIASKLLQRGLSTEDVAEILELDTSVQSKHVTS